MNEQLGEDPFTWPRRRINRRPFLAFLLVLAGLALEALSEFAYDSWWLVGPGVGALVIGFLIGGAYLHNNERENRRWESERDGL